ncbi:MAG: nicotinate-nicotinamide nucleotide adenylyltransferase [bacterium]
MRIALLGGSFDPPHKAHEEVLRYLLGSGRYDQIWVFPTKQNPFKNDSTPFQDRLEMCRLAFQNIDPKIQIRADEAQLSGYTIDLIRHLKAVHPGAEFTFVGGSDLEKELPAWKESAELKKILQFEFLPRPPDPSSPFSPISATELRERVKKGLPIENQVAKPVRDYIEKKRLYQK